MVRCVGKKILRNKNNKTWKYPKSRFSFQRKE